MKLETRICRIGDHEWTRVPAQGRPPAFCPEHRAYGKALAMASPVTRSAAPAAPAATMAPTATPVQATEAIPTAVSVERDSARHMSFGLLLQVAGARVPAMLVGPAGSGKTTAGRHLGEALGLSFDTMSCNPQMSTWDLLGFISASGVYVATPLRRAFESGGVFLLDEVDASNPSILVALNALASCNIGESVTFPDGERVARHADFVLVAGANTYGDGASDEYVGREQLDAATLDRFAAIAWEIDTDLERRAAGMDEWTAYVQSVRAVAEELSLPLLVTPRASINGANLLRSGIARREVENLVIWKGASADVVRSARQGLRSRRAA